MKYQALFVLRSSKIRTFELLQKLMYLFQRLPTIPPPPPPVSEGMSEAENEALCSMLMSWYMSGYHTGYYQVSIA